jgi:hypothetical protein
VPISRRVLLNQTVTRLEALPGPGPTVTVYKGEIPAEPPVIITAGNPDPSGRVAPYAVVYVLGGSPDIEPDLGDANDDLATGIQVTVAAGYEEDALATIDRIHAHLYRWTPNLGSGVIAGRMRPPPGFDPGPVRRDDQPKPPRFWLPLLYTLTATT